VRPVVAAALALVLGAGIAASTSRPASAQRPVRAVPRSVAADCSVDVTRALNRWIHRVPDGAVLEFGRRACYRVDGTLRVVDRHHMSFRGRGSTFRAVTTPPPTPKTTRQMWLLRGSTDIGIHNLTAQGTNPSPAFDVHREWLRLFEVSGGRDIRIAHVHGRNAWGDFVLVTPDIRLIRSSVGTGAVIPRRVTITHSSARVIGRHAVACNGCQALRITDSRFASIGYHVLDLEVDAPTWYARDVRFARNTIGDGIALSVLASGDNLGHDVSDVRIVDNRMLSSSRTCAPPIDIRQTRTVRSNFVIRDNVLRTLGNAIRIGGVDGATMTGNTAYVSDAGCSNPRVAVVARDLASAVLTDNFFPGANQLVVGSGAVDLTGCGNRLTEAGPLLPAPCA
jgi:hypothetical protein